MPARSTSRWVTARMRRRPVGADQDALLLEGRRQFGSAHRTAHVEPDDVGLDARRIELDAGDLGKPLGQMAGVGVVLGQALDVVIERVQAGGGDDPGLAHGAADLLLDPPGLVDEVAASPASTAPTGAPRPLEKSIQTESNGAA